MVFHLLLHLHLPFMLLLVSTHRIIVLGNRCRKNVFRKNVRLQCHLFQSFLPFLPIRHDPDQKVVEISFYFTNCISYPIKSQGPFFPVVSFSAKTRFEFPFLMGHILQFNLCLPFGFSYVIRESSI